MSTRSAPLLLLACAGVALAVACGSTESSDTAPSATEDAKGSATVAATSTLTTDQGWPRVQGIRGDRYCEVLLARVIDARLNAEVWNTYGLNECPPDAWEALDAEAIKAERQVIAAILNGPRYWLMDAIEKKPGGERQETTFGALDMFLAATVDLGPIPPDLSPYIDRHVDRGAIFEFSKGAEIYELLADDGRVYVMQTYSVQSDAALTEADLAGLGSRLTPPAGWTFRSRVLDQTLRLISPDGTAAVIQDSFGNSYTLVETN